MGKPVLESCIVGEQTVPEIGEMKHELQRRPVRNVAVNESRPLIPLSLAPGSVSVSGKVHQPEGAGGTFHGEKVDAPGLSGRCAHMGKAASEKLVHEA